MNTKSVRLRIDRLDFCHLSSLLRYVCELSYRKQYLFIYSLQQDMAVHLLVFLTENLQMHSSLNISSTKNSLNQ